MKVKTARRRINRNKWEIAKAITDRKFNPRKGLGKKIRTYLKVIEKEEKE